MNERNTESGNVSRIVNQTEIPTLVDEGQIKNMSPDEFFKYLDKHIDKLEEPTAIQQIFFTSARMQAKEIQEVRASAVRARKGYIDSLSNSFRIYVKKYEDALGLRLGASVLAASETFAKELNSMNERAISTLVDDLVEFRSDVESKNLPDEIKEELKQKAFTRHKERQDDTYTSFRNLLLDYRKLVQSLIQEIREK